MNGSRLEKSAGAVSESRLVILGVLKKSADPGLARSVVKPGGVVAAVKAGWNTPGQVESELKLEGGHAQSRASWGLTVDVGRE